ncbi:MAG: hypothetical protein OXT67_12150 [Zetaproteobacteria bacterium]|nr:hypothetical protein [Zetaproteobacteria bacterium]
MNKLNDVVALCLRSQFLYGVIVALLTCLTLPAGASPQGVKRKLCDYLECANPVVMEQAKRCLLHKKVPLRCKEPGCERLVYARGVCSAHAEVKLCKTEGCQNIVQSRGLCIRHGGGARCQQPGCERSVQAKGLCVAHGGSRSCKEEGCQRSARLKGRCFIHGGGKRCQEQGCQKFAQSKGLCFLHGGGWRCQQQGCEKKAKTGGLCFFHGGGKRCSQEGCHKHVRRKGLCLSHVRELELQPEPELASTPDQQPEFELMELPEPDQAAEQELFRLASELESICPDFDLWGGCVDQQDLFGVTADLEHEHQEVLAFICELNQGIEDSDA